MALERDGCVVLTVQRSAPLLRSDVLQIRGRDITGEPLSSRREFLDRQIFAEFGEPILPSEVLDTGLADLIHAVKAQGLEGRGSAFLVHAAPASPFGKSASCTFYGHSMVALRAA
jgi:hypothetical protein